jgi:hypothetical protein
LNATADPVWLDLRFIDGDSKEKVQLGIVEFDGDRFLGVRGAWVGAKGYDAAQGNLPGRPKGFTSPRGRPLYTLFERIKP